MFQGATELSLDAKGRLTVPAGHRDLLQVQAEGRVVVTAHPHRCLLLYPRPAWEPIRDRLMALAGFDPKISVVQRLLVGFAKDVEMDAAGRVLVTPELRRFAAFDRQVVLVGQGSHFEIWSSESWQKQVEQMVALGDEPLPAGLENFSL